MLGWISSFVSQGVVGWISSFILQVVVGWISSFISQGVVGWVSSFISRGGGMGQFICNTRDSFLCLSLHTVPLTNSYLLATVQVNTDNNFAAIHHKNNLIILTYY